jgi:hypothetical protein
MRVYPVKSLARVLLVLNLWAMFSSALAYERETHFDLSLYLALRFPCFDLADSLLIASSDLSQDTNETVVAEKDFFKVMVLNVASQSNWHAFGMLEEVQARKLELWTRVENEPNRVKRLHFLGQLLHFDQDSFAHSGFAPGLGHAVPTFFGFDPDSLAYPDRGQQAFDKTVAALQSSLVWLEKTCELDGATAMPTDFSGFDLELIGSLIRSSDPAWRVWQFGGLGETGERIQLELRRQIAAALPSNRLSPAVAATTDRAFLINQFLEWLHVQVDKNGEMLNFEDLSQRLAWIRQGGLPF